MRKTEEQDNLLAYYKEDYFQAYAHDQSERDSMNLNSHILNVIEAQGKRGRLLDVGCGCGYFLRSAKERNWSVWGVDPSEQSIAMARELVGNIVLCGTVKDINVTTLFDVVTMINVIDHMRNPWMELSRSRNLLRSGGCLYLRFPNGLFHSSIIRMQARITDKPILNRLLVFHEYVFTPAFIRKLLTEQGFHHIKIQNARLSGAALYQHTPISLFLGGGLNGCIALVTSFFQYISCGRWLLAPSLEVTAIKN